MQFKRKPWAHQLKAVRQAESLHDYGLFFEQGTGKTATAIHLIRSKFNQAGRILRVLIFTLPLPIPQWREEWIQNSNIDTRLLVPLYGPGAKRLKTFNAQAWEQGHSFSAGEPRSVIFITNYESLLMKDLYRAFTEWEPDVIVFDESHKCKSHSAQRSKLAYDLANPHPKSPRKKPFTYLLTGTPVLNSPMDLFQQFKILDGGQTFGWNYFSFRAKYFRDRNAGMPKDRYFPKWEIMSLAKDGRNATGEIQQLISAKSMRVLKSDCLDLPPEVSVPVKVGMSKEQTRIYNELRKEFVTYYNSKACIATLAITKALRLMQITSGFISTESPGEADGERILHTLPGTPKEAALEELLQEICVEQGHKVLVWAVFKPNYEFIKAVCDRLKIKYIEVHGGVSEGKKRANVEAFKTQDDISVFVGHPGSGGIGLNLTVAPYSIFYSRTFSLEHYLQARARNHRGGSKEAGHSSITHYDLVCEGTIEEIAVEKLANKEEMSENLLSQMVEELVRQDG